LIEISLTLATGGLIWIPFAIHYNTIHYLGRSISWSLISQNYTVAWDLRKFILWQLRDPIISVSLFTLFLSLVSLFLFFKPERIFRRAFFILILILIIQQIPVWSRTDVSGSAYSEQPLYVLADEIKESKKKGISSHLQEYYQHLPQAESELKSLKKDRITESEWKKIRKEFGISRYEKPPIIFVIGETARGLEWSPLSPPSEPIYNELTNLLKKKGVRFNQVYTSAGWTVRGLFQTLCSRFDFLLEETSVYSINPHLKMNCIGDALKNSGYLTANLSAYHRFFGNQYLFDTTHGISEFYDRSIFQAASSEELVDSNEWGLSDEYFFQKVFQKLKEIVHNPTQQKPLFAYILTTGGHAPWQRSKNLPLGKALSQQFQSNDDYLSYLSKLRVFDHSLTSFLQKLETDPILKNALVFIVGDHSTRVLPSSLLPNLHQRELLLNRVMAAIYSPKMKFNLEVNTPIHQIDLAPLALGLAGTPRPPEWLGSAPLRIQDGKLRGKAGTPWFDFGVNGLRYVTSNEICLTLRDGSSNGNYHRQCYHLEKEQDPLLHQELKPTSEDPKISAQFMRWIQASEAQLLFNHVNAVNNF